MWLLITVVALLLAYLYHLAENPSGWEKNRQFNGPKYYPLIGILPWVWGKTQPEQYRLIREWNQKTYRSPMLLKGLLNDVVIQLYDANHVEALFKSRTNISKLQPVYKWMGDWMGQSVLIGDGQRWHSRRKLLTPTFHYDILRDFLPVMYKYSQLLVHYFEEHLNQPVDVRRPIKLAALDTLAETSMGQEFHSLESMKQGKKSSGEEFAAAVAEFAYMVQYRNLKPWLRPDFIWKQTKMCEYTEDLVRTLHDASEAAIAEREDYLNNLTPVPEYIEGQSKPKRKIFMDTLLEMKREGKLTYEEIRSEVDTFMFAGHDTTAMQLNYLCFIFGRHPEWTERCQQEIDYVLAETYPGDEVTIEHLSKMTILERCIKETQRMYPAVPATGRTLSEDLEIEPGMVIPAGTNVIVQIHALHMNPKYWPNPEIFDPDRFLSENLTKRHPFAFVPFAAGMRNCIGQKFAMLELKMVMCNLLRAFDIHCDQSVDDLDLAVNITLVPHGEVLVTFTKRK